MTQTELELAINQKLARNGRVDDLVSLWFEQDKKVRDWLTKFSKKHGEESKAQYEKWFWK